ncbi:MAG: hypothetical protein DI535_07865 [Citrobacter freundii]|nr:MAG: hypothetical protein DI535_07865 [Citrobacter freundii]
MENQHYSNPQESIFSDDLLNRYDFQPATKGQRFLNLFIDSIVMNYGLGFLTAYIAVYITLMINPDFVFDDSPSGNLNMLLYWWILSIINYLIYYTICEKAFRGYTLGKLITGTRAVREDGAELTFRDAAMRTLSRLVPFEAFSGFGHQPWHDSWTRTTVIKAR